MQLFSVYMLKGTFRRNFKLSGKNLWVKFSSKICSDSVKHSRSSTIPDIWDFQISLLQIN